MCRKQLEERDETIEELKKEQNELENSQKQLKKMSLELQKKEAAAEQMLKEHSAAAKIIADSNQLVVDLTDRLREEERQRFELSERLIASEEELAERQRHDSELAQEAIKHMNPVRSSPYGNAGRGLTPNKRKPAMVQSKARPARTAHSNCLWDFSTS